MAILSGMRPGDQAKFLETANALGWWIFVRSTNEYAFQYIGQPGYCPKPVTCKAKTADQTHRAGLVTCPHLVPDAFSKRRLPNAIKIWEDWTHARFDMNRPEANLPPGYSIDLERSTMYGGCVRYQGDRIHADYDLFDVVNPQHPTHHIALATVDGAPAQDMISWHQMQVKKIVNEKLGIKMVQHGMQTSFGEFEEEAVLGFGPHGETELFHTRNELKAFYRRNFEGREALGLYDKAKPRG